MYTRGMQAGMECTHGHGGAYAGTEADMKVCGCTHRQGGTEAETQLQGREDREILRAGWAGRKGWCAGNTIPPVSTLILETCFGGLRHAWHC